MHPLYCAIGHCSIHFENGAGRQGHQCRLEQCSVSPGTKWNLSACEPGEIKIIPARHAVVFLPLRWIVVWSNNSMGASKVCCEHLLVCDRELKSALDSNVGV